MSNEFIGRERDSTPEISGGWDYLWFALFLLVLLVGVAGH